MANILQSDAQDGARLFTAKDASGESIGFALSSLDKNGKLCLDSIHVIPKARRGGVGGALLRAVISWGINNGAQELTGEFYPEFRGGADETAARMFYDKNNIQIDEDNNLRGRLR